MSIRPLLIFVCLLGVGLIIGCSSSASTPSEDSSGSGQLESHLLGAPKDHGKDSGNGNGGGNGNGAGNGNVGGNSNGNDNGKSPTTTSIPIPTATATVALSPMSTPTATASPGAYSDSGDTNEVYSTLELGTPVAEVLVALAWSGRGIPPFLEHALTPPVVKEIIYRILYSKFLVGSSDPSEQIVNAIHSGPVDDGYHAARIAASNSGLQVRTE